LKLVDISPPARAAANRIEKMIRRRFGADVYGTDSAPHAQHFKESACGCAGIYTAHAAIELYAEAFEQLGALDKLEGFASFYGADFYRLPRNTGKITLRKESWRAPDSLAFGEHRLVPLRAGENVAWKIGG